MATIKMAAVSSSTRLLMNLWTAFIGLPESLIAGAHTLVHPGRRRGVSPGWCTKSVGRPATGSEIRTKPLYADRPSKCDGRRRRHRDSADVFRFSLPDPLPGPS